MSAPAVNPLLVEIVYGSFAFPGEQYVRQNVEIPPRHREFPGARFVAGSQLIS